MHIWLCSWALGICPNIGIRTYLADGRNCGVFPPLLRLVWKRPDLPLFLWHLRTAFFEALLLGPLRIWRLWALKSYKVFMEPPYPIVTPYRLALHQKYLWALHSFCTHKNKHKRWLLSSELATSFTRNDHHRALQKNLLRFFFWVQNEYRADFWEIKTAASLLIL